VLSVKSCKAISPLPLEAIAGAANKINVENKAKASAREGVIDGFICEKTIGLKQIITKIDL